MPSWSELFSDPEEGPFFRALMERPRDLALRNDYEHFLRARNDPRAEALALGTRLLQGIPDPEERRAAVARLAELTGPPEIDPWGGLAAHTMDLQNCGQGTDQPARVRFTFECPQSWGGLRPTEDPKIRFCEACSTAVIRCDSIDEAENQARLGACIAVPAGMAHAAVDRHQKLMVTGRPDYRSHWARNLFPED